MFYYTVKQSEGGEECRFRRLPRYNRDDCFPAVRKWWIKIFFYDQEAVVESVVIVWAVVEHASSSSHRDT